MTTAAHAAETAVLEVSGVQWASERPSETVLGRRPGVIAVEANPVAQTATVTYDPALTSVAELSGWIRDCGYHCRGQSVPRHICDPLLEPAAAQHELETEHEASPHEMMGHGGHAGHGPGEMSMAAMVADMRNRFLVAAVLSIPVLLWSPIGREVLGFTVTAPFGPDRHRGDGQDRHAHPGRTGGHRRRRPRAR